MISKSSCGYVFKKWKSRRFPDGLVIKNLPVNADMISISALGRSHMLLSNGAHVPQLLKFVCLEPVLCNERPPQ